MRRGLAADFQVVGLRNDAADISGVISQLKTGRELTMTKGLGYRHRFQAAWLRSCNGL